jgi:hypothetical protein
MPLISVLYVEDNDENYNFYSNNMKRVLEAEYGLELTFIQIHDVDAALNVLKTSGAGYKIVVADMLFRQPSKTGLAARGLDVVRAASRSGGILVIALTMGDIEGYPDLKSDAEISGADIFRFHSQLNTHGEWEKVAEDIYSALLEMRIVPDGTTLLTNGDDPKLQYVISEVGEMTLKRLYEDLLPRDIRPTEIVASYVAPGMSGAFVIHCEGRRRGNISQNHIVKLNKSHEILSREVKNRPTGGYRGGLFIEYLHIGERGIPSRAGWHAIGAVFERGAKTLREWLSNDLVHSAIQDVMHSLFMEEGLARGYSQNLSDKSIRVTDALRLSLSRKARILIAAKELTPIAQHTLGESVWEQSFHGITNFVMRARVGSMDDAEFTSLAFICRCHRDLHAGNVLVRATKLPAVVIIDTAEVGNAHWASDYARLAVDLVMSVHDQGAASYRFDSMEEWRTVCRSLIDRTPLNSDPSQTGALTAISWMVGNFAGVFGFLNGKPDERDWEWCYALATEFLRSAYRLDLTAPKRVLSIVAAWDALTAAENLYKKS